MKQQNKVLYVCDQKQCSKCSKECKHTPDISHAKNFIKRGERFWENDERLMDTCVIEEGDTLILETGIKLLELKDGVIEQMEQKLSDKMGCNVVLLCSGFDMAGVVRASKECDCQKSEKR